MQDFYIKSLQDIDFFQNSHLPITKKELILFEFHSSIDLAIIEEILKKSMQLSDNICLKTTLSNIQRYLPLLQKLSLQQICLQQELTRPNGNSIHPNLYRDTPHYEKSQTALDFLHFYREYETQFKISCEIKLLNNSINLLFPTLMTLLQKEVKFISLCPTELDISTIAPLVKEQFELVKMYANKKTDIFFKRSENSFEKWEAQTLNPFLGPKYVDIDVSNVCTHNCLFCGLYSEERTPENSSFFDAKIDRRTCLDLINSLPDTTTHVTFGGAGDPFTHPHIMEFIAAARSRNFNLFIFTNYAYLNRSKLDHLHSMCQTFDSIIIIVNLSAATPETYTKTRPNQTAATFSKIVENLKYTSKLFKRDGRGIIFKLMSVTNKLNFDDLPNLVALAKETGAFNLWIKPIEVHGKNTLNLLIDQPTILEYARILRLTLFFADQLNVELKDRTCLELIIEGQEKKLAQFDKKQSFSLQKKMTLKIFPLLMDHYLKKRKNILSFYHQYNYLYKPQLFISKPLKKKVTPKSSSIGITNGAYNTQVYDQISCYIAYNYLRIAVDGNVYPCCISKYPIGTNYNIWHSDAISAFRQKTQKINIEKFHHHDPEWLFCQQCPHTQINLTFNQHLHANS